MNKVLVVAIVTLSNVADRNYEKWNKQKINKLWQCRTFHKRKKHGRAEKNNSTPQNRYRLMWMDVKYESGTLKVVAFDSNGKIAAESEVKTAGDPYKIVLEAATYRAACNGDATSLEIFHENKMKLFSGKLVVLVKAVKTEGAIQLEVTGKGLQKGKIGLKSEH